MQPPACAALGASTFGGMNWRACSKLNLTTSSVWDPALTAGTCESCGVAGRSHLFEGTLCVAQKTFALTKVIEILGEAGRVPR